VVVGSYVANLWLVEADGRALQITTDGLVSAVDWK
jgi:hypothetical protein